MKIFPANVYNLLLFKRYATIPNEILICSSFCNVKKNTTLCKWQDVCSKVMEKYREEDCLLSLCLRGQGIKG